MLTRRNLFRAVFRVFLCPGIHPAFRNISLFPRLVRSQQPDAAARAGIARNDCATVLQKTLDEEKATDKKLTSLAESKVNLRAAS
jgi:hypothetical protein